MKVLLDVLKRNAAAMCVLLLAGGAHFAVSKLYGMPLEPFFYAAALSAFCLIVILCVEWAKETERARQRQHALHAVCADTRFLPEARTIAEKDYQEMIRRLSETLSECTNSFNAERQKSLDYYTAWVHQIKTPIAVMKLRLAQDSDESRVLRAELFRIEQYADMVLQYVRLGCETNDLLIREYPLDELIRETLRRYAPLFMEKRLKLDFTPTEMTVVTDRKWLCCILEQLLSNAVKYTPSGTVTVCAENDCLLVSDTGIGIRAEDLPRIFEMGYTGGNGRIGQKSSGLGLYLVKKAADLLSVPVYVKSRADEGATFVLDLSGHVITRNPSVLRS